MINIKQNINIKSTKANNWQEIPWSVVNLKVRDLQDRIVKATLKNEMNQVYKLQSKL